MTEPPWDDPYLQAAPAAGRACAVLLLTERTWVHRRVETVSVLAAQLVRRSVSVDFTLPEAIRPLLSVGDGRHVVPLATLAKRNLRDFDLRDEHGGALPALGSEHNEVIATEALAAHARRVLGRPADEPLDPALRERLAGIAAAPPGPAVRALRELAAAEPRLAADAAMQFLLRELAYNYILLGAGPGLAGRRILKYAYDEQVELVPRRQGLRDRLGLDALLVGIAAPAAARGASYHAEVVIPEELRALGSLLVDERSGAVLAEDGEADRPALYTREVPSDADPVLVFELRPERVGGPVLSALTGVVTAGQLLVGAWVADLQRVEAGPTIGVLLAGSSFFAAAIARSGEHRLVQALFAGPRVLLGLLAVLGLASASALALQLEPGLVDWLWRASSVIAAACAAILVVASVVASPIVRRTRQDPRDAADHPDTA